MGRLLDKINNPDDLKKLALYELEPLAGEIRGAIMESVSSSGGHLASSLGAVELIIGLHYCLNAPEDKIIWDVGHQAYAHKLLTGRKNRFHTLRQIDGLSGFPNINESEYDIFTTGHGSTSISTALGMAAARDIKKERYKVAAIIGDASLGGGMAFEALNHAGHLNKDLLVVLNDNEMSISKSVGALSKYLNRIITAPTYNRIRRDVEHLLERVPKLGFRVIRAAKRLEEGLKNLLVPGMLFEEMGFRYFGPINGNDIRTVVTMLRNVINIDGPVLLHVVTKKGKGYEYAEAIPEKFHGVSSFDIATGEKLPIEKTEKETDSFTKAFGDVMIDAAGMEKRLVAITAAMSEGTGLYKFAKLFPDRFFDVGMAEQHAVSFGAGLAKAGLKPVVAVYSTFMQRSYDQIIHDVCLQNLNVILMIDRAGLVGEDGPTHHGVFDMAYLRNLPNIIVLAPKDEAELKSMFGFALSYNGGPISIRYPRGGSYALSLKSPFGREQISLGKGEILKQGKDVTIIAIGYMSYIALEAAEQLAKDGIDCEVINARFVKPLDLELIIESVLKTGRLWTIEEGVLSGGFGSFVLESIIDKIPESTIIKIMGLPDKFITHGNRDILLDRCGLSVEKLRETIKSCLR